MTEQKTHTISLLVRNKPGVLLRIALIFSRRAFNIESLVVSSALDGRFSRMTITAKGDTESLNEIIKQSNNLIDVVHTLEHEDETAVEKELALIKMSITKQNRLEILQIVENFKAQTIDLTHKSLIIQVTGNTEKINAMIDLLQEYKIVETIRTGKVLMARGEEET